MNGEEETTLYRLYGAGDELLYVGISGPWATRMASHARKKGWWNQVQTIKREILPSRAAALAAEALTIASECPRFNVAGKSRPGRPRPRSKRPSACPCPPEYLRGRSSLERLLIHAGAHEHVTPGYLDPPHDASPEVAEVRKWLKALAESSYVLAEEDAAAAAGDSHPPDRGVST